MSGEKINLQASGPGPVLAAAREEIGVSQREVAEALNLPMDVINAIEVGDNDRLPSHVFARGYVRAYAKLLELDPDPLVAALVLESTEAEEVKVRPSSPLASLVELSPDKIKYLGLGLFAAVVLVVAVSLLTGGEDEAAAQQSTPALQPTTAEDNLAQASVAQVMEDETPRTTIVNADFDATDVAPDGSVIAGPGASSLRDAPVSTMTTNVAAEESAGVPVRRLTATGSERLTLAFAEDCWVSIKNSQGKVLFGNLGKAGETLEFVGEAPFTLLLGYAQGVIVSYNAEPVALTPHTRNNVASLVLGQ